MGCLDRERSSEELAKGSLIAAGVFQLGEYLLGYRRLCLLLPSWGSTLWRRVGHSSKRGYVGHSHLLQGQVEGVNERHPFYAVWKS